jgi:sugar O-acyltransferase (sialic acid O-acetyltransferase NeuD family)
MADPIIVIGAGGHAKVLVDALHRAGREVIGLTTLDHGIAGQSVLGCRLLGNDEILDSYGRDQVRLVNGIGSVDSLAKRKQVFENFKKQGFQFTTVIHPSAIVSSDAKLGEGVQIMAGAIIQPGVAIGDNTIVNTRAAVDHDCKIGEHVHVAPGCTLSGNVAVGAETHIGAGATVIHGITIGRRCLVAAGAVVCSDIPDTGRVAGIPATRMKRHA